MHLWKIGGAALAFGGLLVWAGVFGSFSVCVGGNLFGYCAGVPLALNGYIGVFLTALGLIILAWTFAKERKMIG